MLFLFAFPVWLFPHQRKVCLWIFKVQAVLRLPDTWLLKKANSALPSATGTDYAAFGTTVNVTLGIANLPDGDPDFRAVARNGAADETINDWLGVDTRVDGVDVTMEIIVSGLPAGEYTWTSEHHDGGTGADERKSQWRDGYDTN